MSEELTYKRIEAYLFQRMTEEECASFEAELLTNEKLAKQF